ncbi:MAG TPA: flagellar hook-associated protein FlgK [Spirochaetota bacterium]|nr:flagellar hook-associated protein FlgK [Spirochaetota bacterium]HPI91083.1 flagellar hook-associated protein FlgK [Spirochaetota bacterium]HPR47742.1 flagellar hook-associated protein FlgK [Spirochaetota bacterium]
MNSTFMGLEIGKRGLMSHQQALHVTGHNISNAENKEYSRQRVVITAADPLYIPSLSRAETPGNIGQGSMVSIVERIRDSFIDDRIITEKNTMGYWKARNDYIYQIEMVYNEPSDQGLRSRLDELWRAWEELSKYPEERATREVVKEKAVALTNEVQHVYKQLYELRLSANREIEARVNQINLYARDIRDLNERILKAEAVGDNPNDLKDKRDALIEKLSTIVDISVGRTDKDEIIVYIGSENLVQGEVLHPLEAVADPDNNGFFKVVWKKTGRDVTYSGGELASLVEIRDEVIRGNINNVNAFAINLADLTNEVHRDGFSRRSETNIDFFNHMTLSDNVEGNVDLNSDGVEDVTAIFKVAGNNKIDASAAIGITGTLTFVMNNELESEVQVDYNEKDTALSVIKKINDAHLGVVAYLNHDSQVALKATIAKDDDKKNFIIRHLEDSGQFLVGLTGVLKQSGAQGAFDYRRVNDIAKFLPEREHVTITPKFNPASHMAVSDAIMNDIDRISAAQGKDLGGTGDYNRTNGIGDGSNALRIAKLRHVNSMVDDNTTFNDFYISVVSKVGAQGEESKDRIQNQETLLKNLTNLRESVSGINLDEEMANMVAFQHGYNAAARVINTMDSMLDVIINRMGV